MHITRGDQLGLLGLLLGFGSHVFAQLATMREDHVRLDDPTPYKVSVSSMLYDYVHQLWVRWFAAQHSTLLSHHPARCHTTRPVVTTPAWFAAQHSTLLSHHPAALSQHRLLFRFSINRMVDMSLTDHLARPSSVQYTPIAATTRSPPKMCSCVLTVLVVCLRLQSQSFDESHHLGRCCNVECRDFAGTGWISAKQGLGIA